ncbi:hypothetical protein COOONC_11349, partial [Cooperia oncophora]
MTHPSRLLKNGKRPRVVTPDGTIASSDLVDVVKQRRRIRNQGNVCRGMRKKKPPFPLFPLLNQALFLMKNSKGNDLSLLVGYLKLHSNNLCDRIHYDSQSVLNILIHLNIDCFPVSVYRLGKSIPGKNRILKGVVRNKMLSDSLLCRRKKLDLLMVFKILTGKVSIDRRDLFTLLPSLTRGAKSKLSVPRARTS